MYSFSIFIEAVRHGQHIGKWTPIKDYGESWKAPLTNLDRLANGFTCEVGPSAWFCISQLPDDLAMFCRQCSEYEISPF
jgi:hypothetical protein